MILEKSFTLEVFYYFFDKKNIKKKNGKNSPSPFAVINHVVFSFRKDTPKTWMDLFDDKQYL